MSIGDIGKTPSPVGFSSGDSVREAGLDDGSLSSVQKAGLVVLGLGGVVLAAAASSKTGRRVIGNFFSEVRLPPLCRSEIIHFSRPEVRIFFTGRQMDTVSRFHDMLDFTDDGLRTLMGVYGGEDALMSSVLKHDGGEGMMRSAIEDFSPVDGRSETIENHALNRFFRSFRNARDIPDGEIYLNNSDLLRQINQMPEADLEICLNELRLFQTQITSLAADFFRVDRNVDSILKVEVPDEFTDFQKGNLNDLKNYILRNQQVIAAMERRLTSLRDGLAE